MKQKMKKLLAFVLCLSMLLVQMPIFSASAATIEGGTKYQPTNYATVKDLLAAEPGYSGFVMRYLAPGAEGNDSSDFARVDIGFLNVSGIGGWNYNIGYDPDKVVLAKNLNGTISNIAVNKITGVTSTDPYAALVPLTWTADMLIDDQDARDAIVGHYIFNNSNIGNAWNASAAPIYTFYPSVTTFTYDKSTQKHGGSYAVAATLTQDVVNGDLISYFTILKDSLINTQGSAEAGTEKLAETPIYFASNYFGIETGAELTYDTFHMLSIADTSATGVAGVSSTEESGYETDIRFIGFKDAPEETQQINITVKSGETVLPGATVTFEGTSPKGTINLADIKARTDANGVVKEVVTGDDGSETLKDLYLPYSTATGEPFVMKVNSVKVDGKTYKMPDSHADGYSFTVGLNDSQTEWTYSDMEVVNNAFTFKIQAQDKDGKAIDLTGSKITVGTDTAIGDAASGTDAIQFTISDEGTQPIIVDGVNGYKKLSANIYIEKEDETTATITSTTDSAVSVDDETKTIITVTLTPIETTVTVPVPVPTTETGKLPAASAGDLTVTFTPESGVNPISGTVSTTTDAEGALDTISATADLPDGKYTMTVGGAGIEDAAVPVEVKTVYDENGNATTIVSVGGTLTEGEDGKITATGGVVATGGASDTADNNNDRVIDLSGEAGNATIYDTTDEGNTVVITPGTGSDATDVEPTGTTGTVGSITDVPEINDAIGTEAISDPIYLVKVTPDYDDPSTKAVVNSFTAEVYLSNAAASSGTFGMYFDPDVFKDIDIANVGDYLELNTSELGIVDSGVFRTDEIVNGYNGNNYVLFGWMVNQTTGYDVIDARSEDKLIATITLPVQDALTPVSKLKPEIDKRTIYTMDFAGTMEYTETVKNISGITDPDVLDSALIELVGGSWRPVEMTIPAEDHVALDNSKATRGGFYQIQGPKSLAASNYDSIAYDIRMQFELDTELFVNNRVDFFVTEPDGTPIEGVTINIYNTPYDPANPPTAVATGDTLSTGLINFSLADGTYYYTAAIDTETHYAYPTGTHETSTDGIHCDSFVVSNGVATPSTQGAYPKGDGYTPVVDDCINPQMQAQTFHQVILGAETAGDTLEAKILGDGKAKNSVNYYFTISPNGGKKWNITDVNSDGDTNEHDIAAKLSETAKLYTADNTKTTLEAALRAEPSTAITVTWSETRKQFLIEGTQITGDHIGVTSIGGESVELLRAGDIVLTLPTDWLTDADYVITGKAGRGGKVSWEQDANDGSLGGGTSLTPGASTTNQALITETISGGRRTSGWFVFTPDTDYDIYSVVINGVELTLTDLQKQAADFRYQFTNVSANQNIYVTFAYVDPANPDDPEPVSQAQITVIVGANGEAGITSTAATPLSPATVTESTTQIYYVDAGVDFTIDALPIDGFEVDSFLVNGQTVTDAHTITPIASGEAYTVAITFKEIGGESTHAVVTATIVSGFGTMVPIGVSIYPLDTTPEYLIDPDEFWKLNTDTDAKSIMVNGTDYSHRATDANSDGVYEYVLPTLRGNTTLDVTFTEVKYDVEGRIQIVSNIPTTQVAEATITFTRVADASSGNLSNDTSFDVPSDSMVTTIDGKRYLNFTAEVPAGTWSITVHKQGYLDYTLTKFKVINEAQKIYVGDANSEGGKNVGDPDAVKPIELIPGDAQGEGLAIGFGDAAMVTAGWIPTTSENNKLKGDIDESNYAYTAKASTGSLLQDLGYVGNNMYNVRKSESYYTFMGIDDPDDTTATN